MGNLFQVSNQTTLGVSRDGVRIEHDQIGMIALGDQAAVDQALGDAAGRLPGLGVAHVLPVAQAAVGFFGAAGHEGVAGLGLRPVLQPVAQALGKGLQVLLGTQVMGAGRTVAQAHARHAKLQGAEFGGAHGLVSSGLCSVGLLHFGGLAFQEGPDTGFGFRGRLRDRGHQGLGQ